MHSRNKTVLYNGKVRLQNGAYPSLGRVEVYCTGQWGVVCGDIGQEEADKVCRQLGYTGADRFGFKLRCMGLVNTLNTGTHINFKDLHCT